MAVAISSVRLTFKFSANLIAYREYFYNFTNTNFFCCFAQSMTRARYGSVYNLYLTTLHAYTNPTYISAVPLGKRINDLLLFDYNC